MRAHLINYTVQVEAAWRDGDCFASTDTELYTWKSEEERSPTGQKLKAELSILMVAGCSLDDKVDYLRLWETTRHTRGSVFLQWFPLMILPLHHCIKPTRRVCCCSTHLQFSSHIGVSARGTAVTLIGLTVPWMFFFFKFCCWCVYRF